jgi:hypothetical protein
MRSFVRIRDWVRFSLFFFEAVLFPNSLKERNFVSHYFECTVGRDG